MSMRWVVAFVTGLALLAPAAPATASQGSAPRSPIADELVTELIVAYEPGVPPSEAPGIATGSAAVASSRPLGTGDPIGLGMRTVSLGEPLSSRDAKALAAALAAAPGVRFAVPNSLVSAFGTQSSPGWGLDRIDEAELPLDGSYAYPESATGSGVTAYVIDSGIRSTHADFTGRLDPGMVASGLAGGTEDCFGHGTHVAGTIGGTTYGVAKEVRLTPVRVLGCAGTGTVGQVIEGIAWVISDHTSGPAVANLSLGAGANTALDDAVTAMIDDGITVVVASGNEASDACSSSPARVNAAITVNASDQSDSAADFSNSGSCTDIYAPGVDIASAWFTADTAKATISGTSMAAPQVAGVAARILDEDPLLSPASVWTRIQSDATNVEFAPSGGDPDLLLFASPLAGGIAPTAPRAVAADPGDASASIAWTAPASNGGAAITGYVATAWDAATGGTEAGSCSPIPATDLACAIEGLVNDETYYVELTASNPVGSSPPSSPRIAVTPTAATAPPPPTGGGSGGGSSGSGGSSGASSGGGGGGGSIWTVKEVRPAFGSKEGGDTVLVLGWGFTGATGVSVGGRLAPKFTFINDATIEIVTPPGAVGWQELRVWLPNGSVPAGFEYRDVAVGTPAGTPADATPPAEQPTTAPQPERTPVGFTSSPILRATAADLAGARNLTVRTKLTTRIKSAPLAQLRVDDMTRLRVKGLKRSALITVRVRIDGSYYWLGRVRATSTGVARLPGFTASRAGTYPLRLSTKGSANRYLKVRVR